MTFNPFLAPVPTTTTATVSQLFNGYLSYLQSRSAPSYDHARRVLASVESSIGAHTAVASITARTILPVLADGYAKGSKAQTAWTRALLRTIWNWAIKSPLDYRNPTAQDFGIKQNPLNNIPADSVTLTKSRSRYINQEEIPGYLAFLNHHPTSPASAVLQLALYTGARIEEIADLRVGDYCKDAGTLLLRETKAGNDHTLGLGTMAIKLLDAWSHGKHTGQPIFPSARNQSTPISHNSIYVFFQKSGLQHACPRDTRRTFKTLAQVAGIGRDMLDIIQNHREGSVASRHYDKFYSTSDAIKRMSNALVAWESWVHGHVYQ